MNKKYFLLLFASIIICVSANITSAQTIKTEAARELVKVNAEIAETKEKLSKLQRQVDKIRTEYRVGPNELQNERQMIATLENKIAELERTRQDLAAKPQTRSMPTNQIELLKILVLQNERLLDRLEEKGAN